MDQRQQMQGMSQSNSTESMQRLENLRYDSYTEQPASTPREERALDDIDYMSEDADLSDADPLKDAYRNNARCVSSLITCHIMLPTSSLVGHRSTKKWSSPAVTTVATPKSVSTNSHQSECPEQVSDAGDMAGSPHA